MLDPASSMTTLTPMSETPSITSPHHQLHGSYHGMNHMMSHHHGGPLGGHTPGMNHYGNHHFYMLHLFIFTILQVSSVCCLTHTIVSPKTSSNENKFLSLSF